MCFLENGYCVISSARNTEKSFSFWSRSAWELSLGKFLESGRFLLVEILLSINPCCFWELPVSNHTTGFDLQRPSCPRKENLLLCYIHSFVRFIESCKRSYDGAFYSMLTSLGIVKPNLSHCYFPLWENNPIFYIFWFALERSMRRVV